MSFVFQLKTVFSNDHDQTLPPSCNFHNLLAGITHNLQQHTLSRCLWWAPFDPQLHHYSPDKARLGSTLSWQSLASLRNSHWSAQSSLKISGHFIVTQMIKMIWTYILAIWTMCNHHLHQDSRRLSLPNYQQAVKMIYKLQSQLPPEVQDALFQCPLDQMLEQPPRSCAPGLSAVNAVFNNNWKLLKSTQNSKHLIFICYLEVQTHQWMIYNHSRNPYITAPVWVFCVQLSQRVITLKDQVCCCCWWWCCWLVCVAVVVLMSYVWHCCIMD